MSLYTQLPQGALYAEDPNAANAMFDSAFGGPASAGFPAALGGEQPIQAPGMGNFDLGEGVPDKVKRPGLLGRIRQQPGGSKALLAFGASLLSNQNFFQGLGQGAMAYQNVLDTEADKLKPQLTKDANFTYSTDPLTGKPIFERTPVADFEEGIVDKKLKAADALGRYRTDSTVGLGEKRLSKQDEWHDDEMELRNATLEESKRYHDNSLKNAYDIAKLNNDSRAFEKQLTAGSKPPPAAIQKQVGDYYDIAQKTDLTLNQAQPIVAALSNGSLQLGIASNLANKAKLATGVGVDDGAVMYGQLQTLIEGLRNTILMDARGVQTDGDAERAKAQLLSGTGSNEMVAKNLQVVLRNLQSRRDFAAARASDLSGQYGIETGETDRVVNGGRPAAPRRQAPATGVTSSGAKWRIVG